MAAYKGVAQTNATANPIVNSPPSNSSGRVRISYDEYTLVAGSLPATGDTITFAGEKIPKDSRILFAQVTSAVALGSANIPITLAVGSADPIATAVETSVAGVDYSDTHGEVLTADAYPVLTFGTVTGTPVAGRVVSVMVFYVID